LTRIVWHGPSTGRYGKGTPLDPSISEDINVLTNSVNQFQVQYWVTVFLCSRRKAFPLKAIINAEASEDVDNMDSNGKDTFSLAPRSQEGNCLSHDEICSPVSSRRTQPSCALGGPLHLWMVDHPFKERMNIHQRLDIGKRSNIEFTPFGVNSLKFLHVCLPHLGK
jgi:hypothetical protein